MNWPKLTSQLGRTALVLGLVAGMLGGLGTAAAQAAVGTDPGAVSLSPASGPVNLQPTWSTTQGCAYGFQGSAVFRAVRPTGFPFAIASVTNAVTAPFGGTLLGAPGPLTIAVILSLASVSPGGTTELVVYCYSGPNATGNYDPEMSTFITLSSDGSTYSTSGTNPVPVGEIGGLVFAGLAAIGLVWMQLHRRSRRTQPSLTLPAGSVSTRVVLQGMRAGSSPSAIGGPRSASSVSVPPEREKTREADEKP
jgi:hypothetical protein